MCAPPGAPEYDPGGSLIGKPMKNGVKCRWNQVQSPTFGLTRFCEIGAPFRTVYLNISEIRQCNYYTHCIPLLQAGHSKYTTTET